MSPPRPPINLLYLITDLKYGGAQTVLLSLFDHLDTECYSPQVACLYGGNLPVGNALRARGIRVADLKMSHFWRLDALWRLYRLLKREQIAILHTSLFHASLVGRLVGRLACVPVILTWRQNVSLGGRWRSLVNRLTSGLDDGVVAVAGFVRQAELQESGIPASKVTVIVNCIDFERYANVEPGSRARLRLDFGIPPGDFVIGFIGRFHPQKGIEVLIEAFARIAPDRPGLWLLLVGDGELRPRLRALSEASGGSARTIFTGAREDIPRILAALDLFVLPSLWEGLPLALLEAMAAGLPVVASDVGGVPEILVDGETGCLVPPRDPAALAAAILEFVDHPEIRQRLGAAGQQRVKESFSAQNLVARLTALYEELLLKKGAARP